MDPHDLIAPPTHNRVDSYVQRWVAGTNGNLYVSLINKLQRYPIPTWPTTRPSVVGGLLLDLGCGWGRWMVAAARAGYRPIGIDIKLEPLQAARRVMNAHGVTGDVVVADLAALPFKNATFECVFSYSVIQHVHRRKAAACILEAERLLKDGSVLLVELPLKYGLTNSRRLFRRRKREEENDFESWAVRYYSWRQLNTLFRSVFGKVQISSDCFCGIGVRCEDIDLLPWKYKPIVIVSEILKGCTRVFPPLVRLSDSVFVHSRKCSVEGTFVKASFSQNSGVMEVHGN